MLVTKAKVMVRRVPPSITKIRKINQTKNKNKKTILLETVNQLVHMVMVVKKVAQNQPNIRKINIKHTFNKNNAQIYLSMHAF